MSYKRQLLMWTGIGLFLRLVLMPFTMHGQDLFFINYFPMMLVREGIWDVYGFIRTNFAHFPATYYGPSLFFIMALPHLIFIKLFNAASLVRMLEVSSTMMGRDLTTLHYALAFSKPELFKNLFLMKAPYLIFDFWIGFLLLKLAISKALGLASYAIWMLNIVVLHTTYAIGQVDIITAFFIIYALYAAVKGRPYLSVVLLSLGSATKLFPYFLIPPACLLLGNTWKNRFCLIMTATSISILMYLPFYFSSGNAFLGYFISSKRAGYAGGIKWILTALFLFFYCLVLRNCLKDSSGTNPEQKLIYYFGIILLLSYACLSIRFRYFVYITPLLALIIPHYRRFGLFILSIVFILAFSWLTVRYTQMGLFAPLNPEYFLSLPTVQEVIARFVDVEVVYKITSRVLLLTFFVSAWWLWRIKSNAARRACC